MNTLEILYQAFRVRYSLNQLQQILDRGCRLAVLAPEGSAETIRGFLGEPIVGIGERQPQEDLIVLPWDLDDAATKELRTCDACVVYFPEGPPEVEALEELAGRIPLNVKTLWLCESDAETAKSFHERDLTLPTVRSLPKAAPGPHFLRLLLASLPQISLVLARDWTLLRQVFCQTLTRRTALRNGVRAGISSLPLRSVPGVGPILAMLATSAETMMLTSSQLRLSFVIAAVHGRPLDFFDRISELWPIVGSAFGFRGLSRGLVKLLPGGFRPGTKASIAFAGTFAVGEASRLYYHLGQPDSDEVRRELLRRSHEEGAKEAQLLFRRILAGQSIDDVGVGGTDVIDLVDGLTNIEAVLSDPVMGGAIAEARDHEEETLRSVAGIETPTVPKAGEAETTVLSPEPKPTTDEHTPVAGDSANANKGTVEKALESPKSVIESDAAPTEKPAVEAPSEKPAVEAPSEKPDVEKPVKAAPVEKSTQVTPESAPLAQPEKPQPEKPKADSESSPKRAPKSSGKKDGSGKSKGRGKGKKGSDET